MTSLLIYAQRGLFTFYNIGHGYQQPAFITKKNSLKQ